ncbi:MAG TPA: hypothetical protein VFS58_10905 [Steroidobacteraceae bacterium]|nr:hypothetical protein [Steroidobacteraceae bacterium]
MTPAFRWTLLWLVGSVALIAGALGSITASYVDGQYLPSNPDAFYHARRILDAVVHGMPVADFDAHIHAPEGSWLTWPWGYDTLMARITSLFGPFADEAAANRILMHIPVATAPVAAGLVVVIARQLALPLSLAVLAVLGVALLPITFMSFAVGNIDHHYFEMLMMLGTLSAGLWFFAPRVDASLPAGVLLGLLLGLAMGIHNGLFILQIPVVATLAWRWLRAQPLPERRQIWTFAAALVVGTLAVCLPSEPLQRGFFEYYTLSWFHVYVSACSAAVAVLCAFARSRLTLGVTVAFAVIAALPILGTMGHAGQFLAGDLELLSSVFEVLSPFKLWSLFGEQYSTGLYSWLLVLAVPSLAFNVWLAWASRDPASQFYSITGAFTLALTLLQFRFNVFGIAAMVITPLLAAKFACEKWPDRRRALVLACFAVFVAALGPTYPAWQTRWYLAGSDSYESIRGVFPLLKRECAKHPGIALVTVDDGHYLRYHTDCSVIANPFLLTPQHSAKVRQARELMAMTPEALLINDKLVGYVLVHHGVRVNLARPGIAESPNLENLRTARMSGFKASLLDPNPALPSQFQMLWELKTPAGQVYARLYKVAR